MEKGQKEGYPPFMKYFFWFQYLIHEEMYFLMIKEEKSWNKDTTKVNRYGIRFQHAFYFSVDIYD